MRNWLKKLFNGMTLGEAGIIHLLPLFLLLIGIVAGVYLVQKSGYQLFKPKAAGETVEFLDGNCVKVNKEGKKVLICNQFQMKIRSPLETGTSSDAGSKVNPLANMSLVKTAYAAGSGIGYYCKDQQESKIYHKHCPFLFNLCKFLGNIGYEEQDEDCDSGSACTPYDNLGVKTAECKKQSATTTPTAPQQAAPVNLQPKKGENLTVDNSLFSQQGVPFAWVGSPADHYILMVQSEDGKYVYGNAEGKGVYQQHKFLPAYNVSGGAVSLSARFFESNKTYTWWVDAFDRDGNKTTSDGTQFTVNKTAAAAAPADVPAPAVVAPPVKLGSPPVACPDKKEIYSQCGKTTGLEDKDPTHVYEVTRTTDCNGKLKPYAVVDKGLSAQCQKPAPAQGAPAASVACKSDGLPGDITPEKAECVLRLRPTDITNYYKSQGWCVDTIDHKRAIINDWYNSLASQTDKNQVASCFPPAAGVGPTAPQAPPARTTTKYRLASNPTDLQTATWYDYTAGGVTVNIPSAGYFSIDSSFGTKSIYVQFMDNNQQTIIFDNGLDHKVVNIDFVDITAVAPPAPAAQPAPLPPAGGDTSTACSQFETYSICGGGLLTYDKCTDNLGQTGSQLCSGRATDFYCEGSGNSNCISDPTKQGNYSCSGCPNLVGRAAATVTAPLGIANCYVRPAQVNIGGSVTYQVLVQGGKPPYYFSLTGDFSKNVTSQTGTAEIVQTFDSEGLKRVNLVVGSGSEQSSTFCPAVSVSSFDRSIESSNIPAGSACSAYETTAVCGGGIKTYDKCTDDLGQTGSSLCSGGAAQFYCEGSTNSNCISSTTRTPHYYCSACPNLN